MMRRHTCLEFLSHCVVTFAGSSLWSCAMPFGMRVWRVSVADKKRKFEPGATGTQCMRRDWKCDGEKSQPDRSSLRVHRRDGVPFSTSSRSCLSTALGLSHRCYTCIPLKMKILARLHPSGRGHTHGRLVIPRRISSRGLTWNVSLSICILYWRPWEFGWRWQRHLWRITGLSVNAIFTSRAGACVPGACSRAEQDYSSFTWAFVFFIPDEEVRLVDMYALNLFGVRRHFSTPSFRTLYPYNPRSPIFHHHLDRSFAFGFHQMFF